MRFFAPLALLAAPAFAEPQPAVAELMHYTDAVAGCLEIADTPDLAKSCVGASASLCMETEEGGFSTVGMMFCTLAEYEAWDAELNRAYQTTMVGLRDMDEEEAVHFPEYANRAESLRDAQRAWITLRDADCALEYAMWGSGSFRQVAGASCLLDLTSERAIYIKFLGGRLQ